MRVGGQLHAPAALPRERDPVPIVQEAGWAPKSVWTNEENLARTGIHIIYYILYILYTTYYVLYMCVFEVSEQLNSVRPPRVDTRQLVQIN
jgi:hypothetical protein